MIPKYLGIAFLVIFVNLWMVSCASPPPIQEYTLARTAMQAAKSAESGRYASGYWYKAEEYYRKGQKAYEISDNSQARSHFIQAKQFAEKAENITRLKKFQSGELAP